MAGIFMIAVFAALIYVAIVSAKANKYARDHKYDAVACNNLMNKAETFSSYFRYRDELIEILETMAPTESLLNKSNRLKPKPTKLLKQLKENEELSVHSMITRATEFYKTDICENGPEGYETFEAVIGAFSKRISSSNLDYALNCLESLKPYAAKAQSIAKVDEMDGHTFEYWCANILRKNGFQNVTVTPGSGDQGVDVLAEKGGIKYAVQCKCYSKDLDNTPIQEVNAGKMIYRCQVGAVMTNRRFTKGAKDLADATGTLLWDRDKILEMMQ